MQTSPDRLGDVPRKGVSSQSSQASLAKHVQYTNMDKKTDKKKQPKSRSKLAWYVMVGFNKENPDKVGCLAIDVSPGSKSTYKIVGLSEAKKFPSKNVNHVKGFGTPEQWLELFNSDPELEEWRFHLSKVSG